jgi:hypothetical protein
MGAFVSMVVNLGGPGKVGTFLNSCATRSFSRRTQLHEVSLLLHIDTEREKKTPWPQSQASYTDRATAACQRSWCQLFADRGFHVVSVTNPYGRILGFIDRPHRQR